MVKDSYAHAQWVGKAWIMMLHGDTFLPNEYVSFQLYIKGFNIKKKKEKAPSPPS